MFAASPVCGRWGTGLPSVVSALSTLRTPRTRSTAGISRSGSPGRTTPASVTTPPDVSTCRSPASESVCPATLRTRWVTVASSGTSPLSKPFASNACPFRRLATSAVPFSHSPP